MPGATFLEYLISRKSTKTIMREINIIKELTQDNPADWAIPEIDSHIQELSNMSNPVLLHHSHAVEPSDPQ